MAREEEGPGEKRPGIEISGKEDELMTMEWSTDGRRRRREAETRNQSVALHTSDDDALRRLGLLVLEEGEARCVLEDLPNALACPCRALEVLLRADLLRDDYALLLSCAESRRKERTPKQGGKEERNRK